MIGWMLALGRAFAGEPTVVLDGAVVRGSAFIAAPPEALLAALSDPSWEGMIAGDGTRALLKGTMGSCQRVSYQTPNPVMDASYEVRRCPTADGWQMSLLSSPVLDSYRAQWRVVAEGAGSRVSFEVELSSSLWVPDSLVNSETVRSVEARLRAMDAWARARE